jgi:hypothetical protein
MVPDLHPSTCMNIQGLLYSGVSGLANRGWQELWKSLDRLIVGTGRQDITAWKILRHLGTAPMSSAVADAVMISLARRFLPGGVDPRVPHVFAANFANTKRSLLSSASQRISGRFDLLGYHSLYFGMPVDWHLDAVSMTKAPLVHWSKIDALDVDYVGDSKVIWELNRHQWLVEVGQAYLISGDESYSSFFMRSIDDWMEKNPPGLGINWSSSLEVAFRIISWCWAITFFQDSERISSAFRSRILSCIAVHANHVERYMSHQYSPNTHLMGEALGLYYAGNILRGVDGARRWRKVGRRVILEQTSRQVLPDGVHFELATCYHRYTLEMLIHFIVLARQNNDPIPDLVTQKTQEMLDYLLAIRRPDGSIPEIGDADGGTLLPLTKRSPDDARGVFALAAVLFDRSDYAWAAEAGQPELLWLLGVNAFDSFSVIQASPPTDPPSRAFLHGGYIVMRAGWEPDSNCLIFDVGPLGCPVSSGHGHSDLLSLECAISGVPMIVDPGTYCYSDKDGWRSHFRSSQAHSTVTIDNVSQARCNDLFSWSDRPAAQLVAWRSDLNGDYADANHLAYSRLNDPVRHRRRVLFARRRYWVIVDDLEGEEKHQVDLRFQLASGVYLIEAESGGWIRCCAPSGEQLSVCSFASYAKRHVGEVIRIAQTKAWVATNYGAKREALSLVCALDDTLPIRVVTLLLPCRENEVFSTPTVAVLPQGRLQIKFGQEMITVDERECRIDPFNKVCA